MSDDREGSVTRAFVSLTNSLVQGFDGAIRGIDGKRPTVPVPDGRRLAPPTPRMRQKVVGVLKGSDADKSLARTALLVSLFPESALEGAAQ